jgi:hypothetical protein
LMRHNEAKDKIDGPAGGPLPTFYTEFLIINHIFYTWHVCVS